MGLKPFKKLVHCSNNVIISVKMLNTELPLNLKEDALSIWGVQISNNTQDIYNFINSFINLGKLQRV